MSDCHQYEIYSSILLWYQHFYHSHIQCSNGILNSEHGCMWGTSTRHFSYQLNRDNFQQNIQHFYLKKISLSSVSCSSCLNELSLSGCYIYAIISFVRWGIWHIVLLFSFVITFCAKTGRSKSFNVLKYRKVTHISINMNYEILKTKNCLIYD